MNKILHLLISLLLVVSLISVTAVASDVELQAENPIKNLVVVNGTYDGGDDSRPMGNTGEASDPGLFEVVPDPFGDTTRGNVGHYIKHSELTVSLSNNNVIYIDFDFNLETEATTLSLGVRDGTTRGVTYCYSMKPGNSNGADINLNEWYTAKCVFNYATKKQTLTILDSSGAVISGPTESNLKYTGTNPSHIRFRTYTTSSAYFDNLLVREDVAWPCLDGVTGADGELNPEYTNNKIVLSMTQDMKTVTPADVSIVNNISGEENPAKDIVVNGKQIEITTSRPLQSSATYTLTIFGTAVAKYRSLPLEDTSSIEFTTSSRSFDLTDVAFTSDGNKVSATASFVNNSDDGKTPVVMMSAYNAEGRITAISYTTVEVPSDGNIYRSNPLEITVPEGGCARLTAIGGFEDTAPVNNNIYTFKY